MVSKSVVVNGVEYPIQHELVIENNKFYVKSHTIYSGKKVGVKVEQENIILEEIEDAICAFITEKDKEFYKVDKE